MAIEVSDIDFFFFKFILDPDHTIYN